MQHFQKFDDTTVALAAITSSVEGKIPKQLKKLLKKIADDTQETLLVADAKLGSSIKVSDSLTQQSASTFQLLCLVN